MTRNRIARLESDGRLDQTLNLNVVGQYVQAIAVQPDGKILIGGLFNTVLGVTRNYIARLNSDGTLDAAFNPNASNAIQSIAVQTDGKILAGGAFLSIGGQNRNRIARLDGATGLADSFNPNATGGGVQSIAVQGDGKILVGGLFTGIGGQTRNRIARLDGTTGLADSFNPNAIGGLVVTAVRSIVVQTDGKIVAAGEFGLIGGQLRNNIARLDPATGLADSFNPNANNPVFSIVLQADGKILAGGEFASIGGQTRNRLARLDPATGLADSFNPDVQSAVWSIALQEDGKILVGGEFQAIGGQLRSRIARLDPATGLPDSFDPSSNRVVMAIALQPDGKVLAGGNFELFIGGQTRSFFARLSNDTAALQNLAATPATVTWTRAGSSPRFKRVSFESSTDSVNYTPLGNGTGVGSNWTLTGLNLPMGQNIYIRARGFYPGGIFNGSESITESVGNVFLAPPPAPTAVVSRKVHNGVPFDINLPFAGNSIECRSGGASNDYSVVFTFPDAVTFSSAFVSGTGSVSSTSGSGTTTITVNLTGVTNAQTIGVTLFGVNNGMSTSDVVVPMGVLIGDSNGDGFVNAADTLQTRNRSGQPTDAANFRSDVNTDGFVNSGDTLAVRSRSGTSLP